MSLGDKFKHGAEEAVGKVKEAVGDAKGDDSLKAEGQTDQTKANVKQTGDDVKDVFTK